MDGEAGVPAGLREPVREALAALEAAPDGWLSLPDRRRLRDAYGPDVPPDRPGGPSVGLLRRAELLVACAHRALPRWEERFPADRRPHELVAAILPLLHGERAVEELRALRRALEPNVEDLVADRESWDAYRAGRAAMDAWIEAWDGEPDPEFHPLETTLDSDFDEPRVEALAADALALDDPEAMREFWRWYVSEAFPAAYRAVPDDGGWIDGR